MSALSRLFGAKSLAVIGGGAWGAALIRQARAMGFAGPIWPVHPHRSELGGEAAVARIADLPGAPDAAFVAVNRHATVEAVRALSAMGAGGAVCFASGFSEAGAEDAAGADLQAALVAAAGEMPLLGPNCYGFVNALDRVAVWPDQHGMQPVARGVAILTQSSNIAINLTMQRRALPIAMTVACGNQAVLGQADLAMALLDDPRITAIGLHVEGFGDLRAWEALAARARVRGVPLVALKVGRSEQAQAAAVSHTASLAGGDAGAGALLARLGILRADDLPVFVELLKLMHLRGRLGTPRIASISCSGGEASLVADMALQRRLALPALAPAQHDDLRAVLGPMVALANPLDYHTYIWRDADAMARAWAAMTRDDLGMTLSVVDYPHTDPQDWTFATRAALQVVALTGRAFGVVASMPELMPPDVAQELMAGGVVPFCGLAEALDAIRIASQPMPEPAAPLWLAPAPKGVHLLDEARAKAALAATGVDVPALCVADDVAAAQAWAVGRDGPFAVKGMGAAHKSEAGLVRLNVAHADLGGVISDLGPPVLIEEMITGGLAELLIGVVRDPAHGFVLTLAAGGVQTEILQDSVSLLLPASDASVSAALDGLRIAPLLRGYRGQPPADRAAILRTVRALSTYLHDHAGQIDEIEINPLICTPARAVAADALIRKGDP